VQIEEEEYGKVLYKIKQLGKIILKMKVKNFDKSHCSRVVVAGILVQRLQLAHRTFRKLNLIVCHVSRAGVDSCPMPYTSPCSCPPSRRDTETPPVFAL
jgi:hypothetical protein